ncbi:MAG: 16S rRNA (guanine(966)-N(2))-methyltransferase RsmD [Bacteroides sp.]
MRVIAGTARSMPLKSVAGLETRPTQDRIKETLFNVIQADVPGARFLDLFAGSGAIGIEALSRGAKEAVFVENAKAAVECIKSNLEFTKLKDSAVVMECDVLTALNRLSGKGVFDVIHMDPPYNHDYEKQVLSALKGSDIVDSYTLIIIEASLETDFSYLASLGYSVIKEKNYKNNKHVFLNMDGGEN